jgi:hypothetical protein
MVRHRIDARLPHSVHRHSDGRASVSSTARSRADLANATARSRARKASKGTQLPLPGLSKHGGVRQGAGRKHGGARSGAGRKAGRTKVAHNTRPVHDSRHPVHITLRTVEKLVSLRRPRLYAALRSAIARSQRGAAFRITDCGNRTIVNAQIGPS